MNFSNEIIKILDDLSKRLGVAIDWSNENIMPYLNGLVDRFINFEIAKSIIAIVISILIIVIGICIAGHIWKHRAEYDYFGDLDETETWIFIFGVCATIIGTVILSCKCCEICEAIYLPEKQIYDYIQVLCNGK